MFELGMLELESKAKIEIIYWQIAQSVVELCRGMRYVPEEVKELETSLGDQYLCNFSVFQSLLDHWALGQLFPIMPVHHLEQPPDRNGTLVDITCDSDGKVSEVYRLARCEGDFAAPSDSSRGILLPWFLSDGCVPGYHG